MKKAVGVILLLPLVISCKKPYNPPAITAASNYLVVEGIINTGADSTIIKLSRTVSISSFGGSKPELHAQVTVEDNQNNSYTISEIGNGEYASPSLGLSNARLYRISIKTSNGETYLSSFVQPKAAPPIDSIGYKIQSNGVQVYLNTHDPANNTHYYLWQYGETWIFHSAWLSYSKIVDSLAVFIYNPGPSDEKYQCWGHDTSTTIVSGSSAKLSQDVIYQAPITFLPSTSEKLESKYSILIKQSALTAGAFNYYQLLKSNTENVGSIFSPQPSSDLTGNVYCVNNPSEPVIGHLTAGTVSEKRIFIDNSILPQWKTISFYDTYGCPFDTTHLNYNQLKYDYGGNTPIYYPILPPNFAAPDICVDCTVRGTNIEPVFWK
jgi:hypothetical protein